MERFSHFGWQKTELINAKASLRYRKLKSFLKKWPLHSGDNLVMEKEKNGKMIHNEMKISPEPLPSGWGMQRLPSGRILFVDNKNQLTTWIDPRLEQKRNLKPPWKKPEKNNEQLLSRTAVCFRFFMDASRCENSFIHSW